MNKRQAKKKEKRENKLLDVWGYPMSYREEKQVKRCYHEHIVSVEFRNIKDDYDCELASILGITYRKEENRYHYPNRFRFRTYDREVSRVYENKKA